MIELPRLATLEEYRSRKLISVEQHPQDPHLFIYNYTPTCQYSGAWDEVTRLCRGLILGVYAADPEMHFLDGDRLAVCRALPFPKFFNYGEHGVIQDIPNRPPDTVTVKLDGSLGISYRMCGELQWATRGSFGSVQAAAANRIWRERYAHRLDTLIPGEFTLLVEIIAPETRNIVRYDFEDLVLLGIRNHHTGYDLPYVDVQSIARIWDMRVAEQVEGDLPSLIERAKGMSATEEGFVLRWGNFRLKVKSEQYMACARFLSGVNERRVLEQWYHGRWRSRADLPEAIPEEFVGEILKQIAQMEEELVGTEEDLARMLRRIEGMTDRKAVVDVLRADLGNLQNPLFHQVMQVFSGKPADPRAVVYHRREGKPPPK